MWAIIDEMAKWGLRVAVFGFIVAVGVAIGFFIVLFLKNVRIGYREARQKREIEKIKRFKRLGGNDNMN